MVDPSGAERGLRPLRRPGVARNAASLALQIPLQTTGGPGALVSFHRGKDAVHPIHQPSLP
jgi:hypothetical protein